MTVKELNAIIKAESDAWDELWERRWLLLRNGEIPRGCGYQTAIEYSDSKAGVELAAWEYAHEISVSRGVCVSETDYSKAFQRVFRRYAENK